MFGDPLQLPHLLAFVGLWHLSMIVLVWLGYICWNIRMMCLVCFNFFIQWFKLNFQLKFRSFTLTMVVISGLLCNPWTPSWNIMCSNTQKKNGVAVRKNRLILETTCALLFGAHVPSRYWDDAIVMTVYLLNCMPLKVLQFKTPLQVIFEHVSLPTILLLPPRIFGCVAFVHLNKNQRTKLDPCTIRCIFVRYATHQKGYRCYHPATKHTYVTMDVTFLESETLFSSSVSTSSFQGEIRDEELNWWTWKGFEDNPV